MNSTELSDSIRVLGPLLPTLVCCGQVIDGAKREKIAAEVGRETVKIELEPGEVLRALYVVHPERALERAGKRSLDDYARVFGVRALTVAEFLRTQKQNAPAVDAEAFGGKSVMQQQWWPPRLLYFAQRAARDRGMNLSAFVREAVATHVTRTIPISGIHELASDRSEQRSPRVPRSVAGSEHRPRGRRA